MIKKLRNAVLAAACIGALSVGAVEAKQINYALGAPPNTPAHEAVKEFAEALKEYSDGEMKARIYALSLLNFAEMSAGLRDKIADMGLVLTPYNPAEYAPINLLGESSMMLQLIDGDIKGKEGMAFGAAMSEYIFFNCPDCMQSYKQQNQVYVGHGAGTTYGLMCKTPVVTSADLKGKRIRVGASNFARWAQSMGATPVTMSANEMLEALSQGIVDCIALSSPEILNFGLGDTITDLTMAVPGGVFPFSFQVNQDTWRSLNEKQRLALLQASAVGAAAISYRYNMSADEGLALVRKNGAKFHQASDELIASSHKFVEGDMTTLVEQYRKQYKLNDADKILASFRPILEKWVERVKGVESREDMVELYMEHIISKLDASTYGM